MKEGDGAGDGSDRGREYITEIDHHQTICVKHDISPVGVGDRGVDDVDDINGIDSVEVLTT